MVTEMTRNPSRPSAMKMRVFLRACHDRGYGVAAQSASNIEHPETGQVRYGPVAMASPEFGPLRQLMVEPVDMIGRRLIGLLRPFIVPRHRSPHTVHIWISLRWLVSQYTYENPPFLI